MYVCVYDEGAKNASKSPDLMYFSSTILQHWMSFSYEKNLKCPLLEIETELQPEYLCIMQSSHIPDVLCLHSPTGPPIQV